MADVITRFKLETTQFDSKLRDTAKALQGISHQASLGGKDFNKFSEEAVKSARALGTVQSGANNTKDKLRDLVGSYNDAAKAYNSLTDAAKKGEFGKAMSASLQQLQQRIRETKEELYSMGDAVKGGGGGLFGGGKLDGMLQVFGGNVMTKIAGAGLNFASELGDMVKQGIELARAGEGIRIAFERLGRGDILDGLRKATHGTVTDLELMKAAVKFNDFKLPLDELGTMLAFAQQKAKDTGQSASYLVDSIVNGLGRKSKPILDNLGISATELDERMKETGDMTKAVGEIIREQMAKAGDYVETAADRATQANVSLQNKMEELGRKFAPIEEASNQLWTSMKIGILDVVGGPLAKMLNSLTEAGRLMNALSDNNGEQGSGNTKVDQQLNKLRGSNYKQFYYNKVVGNYTKQINDLQAQINNGGKKPGAGSGTSQDVRYLTAQKQSLEEMRRLFKSGAKDIMQPVKVDINTDEAEQNVASLTKKLKELQAQRKKAIASGDKQKSADLLKQINQTKNDIKDLGGGTTTTTHTLTKQERAQESFTKAEQDYKQALEQAAMELEAGTITRAQAAQKEAQAAEQRWKAIGDARNINDSDRLRQAQDEAAAEYKRLAAEAKTATEHQKALDKVTRDLENANQKLATARTEMAQARQQGDLQAYNTAKDKATAAQNEITRLEKVKVDVETGRVDLPDIPATTTTTVDFQADTRNINAAISDVKKEMDTIPVGTIEFNLDQTKLVDLTTLKTLIDEQVKNGLEIAPEATQGLFSKIQLGVDIEDTTWQELIDKINEKLKKLGLDPIKLDLTTGETSKKGREKKNPYFQTDEKGNEKASLAGVMGGIANGMSQMVSGMESLGVEIPEGIKGAINAIQGVSTILTGIATTVLAIEALSTANLFKLFSHGGVVHAANGYVDGNTYSGDQIPAMLNAGEVVLNRSQQGVLAASLQAVGQSGEGGGGGKPYVSGELIWLGLNNYLNRSGRGEIVTSKRR